MMTQFILKGLTFIAMAAILTTLMLGFLTFYFNRGL